MGDSTGEYYRDYKGHTRSLDCSSYVPTDKTPQQTPATSSVTTAGMQ